MAKALKAKKKLGRPSKGARPAIKFRVPPFLLEKLERAASDEHRPVSEIIENRLERSFLDEKQQAEALQYESDMRVQAEDELKRALAQIEQLELLKLNIGEAVERAVSSAFEKAGLLKKDGGQP